MQEMSAATRDNGVDRATDQNRCIHDPQAVRALHAKLRVNDSPRGICGRHARRAGRVEDGDSILAHSSNDILVGFSSAYGSERVEDVTVPELGGDEASGGLDGGEHGEAVELCGQECRVDEWEGEGIRGRQLNRAHCRCFS